MAEYRPLAPSPLRVHPHAFELSGFRPCWQREHYTGGVYSTEHFRTCSYCRCIHPDDLIELLNCGSQLEPTLKPGKFLLVTPNPVAGELVRIGSVAGRVFEQARWPLDLKHHLFADARYDLRFEPTIGERLAGHFERPALENAPATILWPFYSLHTDKRQWPEIWAAAKHGERNAQV